MLRIGPLWVEVSWCRDKEVVFRVRGCLGPSSGLDLSWPLSPLPRDNGARQPCTMAVEEHLLVLCTTIPQTSAALLQSSNLSEALRAVSRSKRRLEGKEHRSCHPITTSPPSLVTTLFPFQSDRVAYIDRRPQRPLSFRRLRTRCCPPPARAASPRGPPIRAAVGSAPAPVLPSTVLRDIRDTTYTAHP